MAGKAGEQGGPPLHAGVWVLHSLTPCPPQWLQGWPMGVPVVIWPARQRCPWHKVLQLPKEGHQHQEKCVCPVLAAGEPSKQACGAEGSEDNRGIRRGEDRCCV